MNSLFIVNWYMSFSFFKTFWDPAIYHCRSGCKFVSITLRSEWNIIFFTIWLSVEIFLAKLENYFKKWPKLCLFDFWLGFMWILLMQMSKLTAFWCSKWFVNVLWSGQYRVWQFCFYSLYSWSSVLFLYSALFWELWCQAVMHLVCFISSLWEVKKKNRSMLFCVKAHTRPLNQWRDFFSKNSC